MGVLDSIFRFLAGVPAKSKTEVEKVVPVMEEEKPKKATRGRPSTKKSLTSTEWPFPTAAAPAKKTAAKKTATKKTATKTTTKKPTTKKTTKKTK